MTSAGFLTSPNTFALVWARCPFEWYPMFSAMGVVRSPFGRLRQTRTVANLTGQKCTHLYPFRRRNSLAQKFWRSVPSVYTFHLGQCRQYYCERSVSLLTMGTSGHEGSHSLCTLPSKTQKHMCTYLIHDLLVLYGVSVRTRLRGGYVHKWERIPNQRSSTISCFNMYCVIYHLCLF